MVNLGRTLFFDAESLQRNSPESSVALVKDEQELQAAIKNGTKLIFLAAEDYFVLGSVKLGLFVNIASMQEMTHEVIKNYFGIINRVKDQISYFYCCNRVEKKLPGGEVIQFSGYPWGNAKVLVSELCPWYQRFPIGRPPWWKPFDGSTAHRLVKYCE